MFYNIADIKKKTLKLYNSGDVFRDMLNKQSIFPFRIKLKKIRQSDIQNSFIVLQTELKKIQSQNLNLIYQEFHYKTIGSQKLPIQIEFNIDELLNFIGKKDESNSFINIYKKTISSYSKLEELILQKPFLFLQNRTILDELFFVCDFFVNNPKPYIYLRELSISGVDTKFIENNKKVLDIFLNILLDEKYYKKEIINLSNHGFEKKYYLKYPLPLIRFRILDETKKIGGLSDLSVTIEEFKNINIDIKNIFIIENKMTMLSFLNIKDSIVIFGSGYGVEILKDIYWLDDRNIFYWGDIDVDGYAILSMLRGYFPHTKSIFMDKKTIDKFLKFSVIQKEVVKSRVLAHLTSEEMKIYHSLKNGFRLEQEKIYLDYVKEVINDYII